MMKSAWTTVFAAGLAAGILPSRASAHGDYLDEVQRAAEDAGAAPCSLEGMTCGLCHEPNDGDRNENIGVGFGDIDVETRNGPFYESLMGAAGWDHGPHGGGGGHIQTNLALLETALMAMVDMNIDSDSDGVGDIEELSLGYNPLLAYDEGDPEASQICGDAEDFPEVSGSSSTTDDPGTSGTTGGDPPGTTGTTGGDPPGTTGGGNDDTTGDDPPVTTNPPGDGSTTGGFGDGSTSTAGGGGGGGDEGGCRIGGTGYGRGALGMLLLLGVAARRRRYA